ncbi:MAG: hypothetical protein JXR77_06065 [Lentisphaeria bacterium]|nr:hypothetical protein [Lentisphaeria bacterium]
MLDRIQSHLHRMLEVGRDAHGPHHTAMWLSSVDLHRGGMPEAVDPCRKRVYRLIHAPRGSTLYWDQPLLLAAHRVAARGGESRFSEAADAYVRDMLRLCVSPANGLILWGNHMYYDVETDRVVSFSGGPHEVRPLPPLWDLFHRVDPEATARAIRAIGTQHIHNPETGEFCRHASVKATRPPSPDREGVHPFLEAGATIVTSLSWLSAQDPPDRDALIRSALRCAEYSFAQRGERTGLLRNQPVKHRWDYRCTTTEVGFWAGCLAWAARTTGQRRFLDRAAAAAKAYLAYGWDAEAGLFHGMLRVDDGTPETRRETEYQPGEHADAWAFLFPTHDYPMPFAEACLTLWRDTGDLAFRGGAERWIKHIAGSMPPGDGQGAYAEHYGRCIHFLRRAERELASAEAGRLADAITQHALDTLWVPQAGMFRSHPGEDRADAVDGLGILFLALLDDTHDNAGRTAECLF